jgi:hypothetical protein
MAPTVIEGIEGAKALVGQELGTSSWYEVTQEKINAFADATGDHNFIHIDEEAAAKTPFGSTIAHGLFTLSLGPMFTYEIMTATNVTFAVNYGYDKVMIPFPATFSAPPPRATSTSVMLSLQYLVCKDECLPGEAQLELTLLTLSGTGH